MNAARAGTASALLAGLAHGLLAALDGLRQPLAAHGAPAPAFLDALVLLAVLPPALLLVHRLMQQQAARFLDAPGQLRFARFAPWTYPLLPLAGLAAEPGVALTMALVVALLLVQAIAFALLLGKGGRDRVVTSPGWVPLLFLVSGFSALIYQVVWQRVLFTTFGVNTESVTVVVSVFMFGLGVGALLGGYLQQRYPARLLRIFLLLETGIGLFGLASVDLIGLAGATAGAVSPAALVLRVYAVLAIPTLLMGATLPVLVAFLQGYYRNIGKTIGQLYALNTIGSAVAAFATVSVIFVLTGLKAAIVIAALCNLATAWLIFDAARRHGPAAQVAEPDAQAEAVPAQALPYWVVFCLLALVGFISLSHEILWFRLLGYMSANKPQVFGLMLAAFLVGIAAGSLRAKAICEGDAPAGAFLLKSLLAATLAFYLAMPAIAQLTAWFGSALGLVAGYGAVGLVAFYCGGLLPVLVHLGTPQRNGGSTLQVAWLYFANIIGATTGPLITGFWLLDRYSLRDSVALLSALTLAVAALLAWRLAAPGRRLPSLALPALATSVVVLAAWGLHGLLFQGYLEKMLYAQGDARPFRSTLENRAGIITVEAAAEDVMYGSGIYDGRFNTDPVANTNGIDRAYMVAALHPQPREVLEIGLSTGSWTRVLSSYAPLRRLTVVEINKGYPAVAASYPQIAGIFRNDKVDVTIDDARRWLRNNPQRRFDVIVMNNTFHWRSNSTNLLSREFLELCRSHLNPGGVLYYNSTGARDVAYTAAHVFGHVTMVNTFVAASDAPFDMGAADRRANLLQFRLDGDKPLFEASPAHRNKLEELSLRPLPELRDELLRDPRLQLVTDDNMAVEYKLRPQP